MQIHGANDLASKSQGSSDFNIVKPKEEVTYSYKHDIKVRCICGIASNTLASNTQSMLKVYVKYFVLKLLNVQIIRCAVRKALVHLA